MKKITVIFLVIIFTLSIFAPGSDIQSKTESIVLQSSKQKAIESFKKVVDSNNYKKGEILVKFNENTSNTEITSIFESQALNVEKEISENLFLASFDSGKIKMLNLMDKLNKNGKIAFAEPNYIRSRSSAIPEDNPRFAFQWGLNNQENSIDINVKKAWKITKGSPSVVIGVIDSGIDINHEDIYNNIWENKAEIAGNLIDDDKNGYIDDQFGWNFLMEDKSITDKFGHGSHVAGIIAAEDNNKGIVGVAPEARVASLKVGDGNFDIVDIIEAIKYGDKKNFKIFNSSYSSSDYSNAEMEAMKAADALFICAAGNDSKNIDTKPVYPACYKINNIISVGAVNEYGKAPKFSNYGVKNVDISAPGIDIESLSLEKSENYAYGDGTSMSAPFVSGVAALVLSKNKSLSPLELKKVILDNGRKLTALTNKNFKGSIVDAYAAVKAGAAKTVIPVKGISYSKTAQSVNKNNKLLLKAIIDPWDATDQKLVWKSSDETIATVNNYGKVTAIKLGKTDISVTTNDGSKTAICSVSVIEPVPIVYSKSGKFRVKIKAPYVNTGKIKIYMIKPNGDFAEFDGKAFENLDETESYYYVDLKVDDDGIIGKNEIDPLEDFGTWEIDSVTLNENLSGNETFVNEKYYKSSKTSIDELYMDESKFAIKGLRGEMNDNSKNSADKALVGEGEGKPSFEKVEISSAEAFSGNIIKIKIFSKDPTGIWSGKVVFLMPNGKEATFTLDTSSREGYYYCYIKVDDNGKLGVNEINVKKDFGNWKLKNVELVNINSAKAVYSNKDMKEAGTLVDMSKADFKVVDSIVPVTSLKLFRSSGTILVGGKTRVIYTPLPSNCSFKDLKWVSSNTKIATVSSVGVIKGIAKGNVKIQGIAKDGSGVKLNYSLKVNKIYYITKVAAPYSMGILLGKTYQMKISIYPYYATYKKLIFTYSRQGIVRIDSKGKVIGLKKGKVTVKIRASDSHGKYDLCYITVK